MHFFCNGKKIFFLMALLLSSRLLVGDVQCHISEQCQKVAECLARVTDNDEGLLATLALLEEAFTLHSEAVKKRVEEEQEEEQVYQKKIAVVETQQSQHINPIPPLHTSHTSAVSNTSVKAAAQCYVKALWNKIPWPIRGSMQGFPWLCAGFWLATKMQLCWCRYYVDNGLLNKCWLC